MNLTLGEIKIKKAQIEKTILTLLKEFEENTELVITDLKTTRVENVNKKREIVSFGMDVKVEND